MRYIESRIVGKLVSDILAAGYAISVYDGEEYALKRATKKTVIMKEIGATDETQLVIRDTNEEKTYIGWVLLIHGNDAEVITDHSVSIEHLVAGASKLAEKYLG